MNKSIDWLLVDGYNLMYELYRPEEDQNLEELRNSLIEVLLNFSGYHLLRTQIVFDGKGLQLDKEKKNSLFEVVFTRSNETADQWIELETQQLIREGWKVRVVTSDLLEQQQTFGSGALRISSREMAIELKTTQNEIGKIMELKEKNKSRTEIGGRLDPEVALMFEKWRHEGLGK